MATQSDAVSPARRVATPVAAEASGRAESLLVAGGYGCYVVALTVYLAIRGQFPTPDLLVIGLLPLVLALGRWKAFLVDWTPFLLLVMAYGQVSGLIYQPDMTANVFPVIHLEQALFGDPIPALRLQQWFASDRIMPWDIAATVLYLMHFVVPVAAGFWFWKSSRRIYWRYVLGLTLLAYLGFFTYVLYPQEPPWLAALGGHLPPVTEIFARTMQQFTIYRPFLSVWEGITFNPVAAMPSIHAAFPVYVYLALARVHRGWASTLAVFYPVAVIVAIVYRGHHFVVDAIAGALYAVFCFWLVWDAPTAVRSLRARWASRAEARRLATAEERA